MDLGIPINILFIVAGGYYFSTQCYLLKYRVLRESGHRLYLSAATCGSALFLIVFLVYKIHQYVWFDCLEFPLVYRIENERDIFSLSTFLLGILLVLIINKHDDIKEKSLIRVWSKNDIDSICSEAITEFKPISITLENNKVYIGLVYDSLEPEKEGYLTILPLYSGYRAKETLELKLDKKYTSVYELIDSLERQRSSENDAELEKLKDFRIVIPRERIITLNISANLLYKDLIDPEQRV